MDDATRGVKFIFKAEVDPAARRAFEDFGAEITALEQRMQNMRMSVTGMPSAVGARGNGNGNGNGTTSTTFQQPIHAPSSGSSPAMSDQQVIEQTRRVMLNASTMAAMTTVIQQVERRMQSQRLATTGSVPPRGAGNAPEPAGWQALSAQGREAMADRSGANKFQAGLERIAKDKHDADSIAAREANMAANREQRNNDRIQRERQRTLGRDVKNDERFWTDFEKYGQKSKTTRERQQAANDKQRQQQEAREAREAAARQRQQAEEDRVWQLAGFGAGGGRPTGAGGMRAPSRADVQDPFGLAGYGRQQSQERAREAKEGQQHARQREAAEVRAAREAEIAAARQVEAQHRLRESVGSTTDAVTRLGEGFAYFGLIGQRDMDHLRDSLLRIRGTAESVRGFVGTMQGLRGIRGAMSGVRNPAEAHPAGFDSILSSALPRAVSVAAQGARLGAGAFAGSAGLIVGGITTALALAVDQAAGGRMTKAGGRFMANAGMSISQGMHGFGNMMETMGMDEGQRRQIEYGRQTQMENPYRPSGWGIGDLLSIPGAILTANTQYQSGVGRDLDAAAAAQRNTARLGGIHARQQQQRLLRQGIETEETHGLIQQSSLARAQEDIAADLRRDKRMAYRGAALTEFYLGAKDEHGQRGTGHTGIMYRGKESKIFGDATIIRDRGERMTFLQRRRDMALEREREDDQLVQRKKSLDADFNRVSQHAATLSPTSDAAREEAARHLKEIDRERMQLAQQLLQITQKRNREDIESQMTLLKFAAQRSKEAQDRAAGASRNFGAMQERLGAMNPMQFSALANARKRAESGSELTVNELELLEQGDERSRALAAQERRKRFREMAKQYDSEGLLGNVERLQNTSTAAGAEKAMSREGAMTNELSGKVNELNVNGSYEIVVDHRYDLGAIENASTELERLLARIVAQHDEELTKMIDRRVNEAAQRQNAQNRSNAR